MMNKHLKIIFAFLSLNLFFQGFSYAQERILVVKDESGNPVAGATVIIGEDGEPILTNEMGEFNVAANSRAILVKAEGYDSNLISYNPQSSDNEIVLRKMPFHLGEKDEVDVPFGKVKK